MDLFNVAAAASSILALAFALWQHSQARQQKAQERERLDAQSRAVRAALGIAMAGAHTADLIVQRAKEPDVQVAELQNLARAARGTTLSLAAQLEDQSKLLSTWSFGRKAMDSRNDVGEGRKGTGGGH